MFRKVGERRKTVEKKSTESFRRELFAMHKLLGYLLSLIFPLIFPVNYVKFLVKYPVMKECNFLLIPGTDEVFSIYFMHVIIYSTFRVWYITVV